ncbi:hypothetical protein GIB67_013155 [Kingdonia uniflora]|uniref:PGG domain-containing protein n=1 Tax=Kingdonia uniflora TaxID=39325 RepID=A0A7J7LCJ4_9MAGN|nr:hypothetical protein GIB67_013155 [Kingdonia uniflora]
MSHSIQREEIRSDPTDDISFYTPLYKAAFQGEWKILESFYVLYPDTSINVAISGSGKTALHIAAASGQTTFVKKLVRHEKMTPEMLEKTDSGGHTALYYAVAAGHLEAVKAMVKENPKLPQIKNLDKRSPILEAALLGHRELLEYLYVKTADDMPYDGQDLREASPFQGELGVMLLNAIIAADFYDIAIALVKLHPEVATIRVGKGDSALDVLAQRSSSFESGTKLGFWRQCIYSGIHVVHSNRGPLKSNGYLKLEKLPSITEETQGPSHPAMEHDLEDPKPKVLDMTLVSKKTLGDWIQGAFASKIRLVLRRLRLFWDTTILLVLRRIRLFWDTTILLVPCIKNVHNTKLMHQEAVELVNCICEEVANLKNHKKISELVNMPFLVAAECGTVEFILGCLDFFPALMWVHYKSHTILHCCIINRQEKVFELFYHKRINTCQKSLAAYQDEEGNNILHLAAKIAPAEKLKTISGSALQMQREIQWFKAVEKITKPTYRELKNKRQKKPRALFVEQHKQLVTEGEKWMRELSQSCSVVATLIATMVFAAAFTVPGGNLQDKGVPIFLRNRYYIVFAISDALALISSLTSVLIFLSALTSRYAEDDFLVSLPRKLINGLATLFFSIATMAIAFMSTYFIMFSSHYAGIAILVALVICVPAILFVGSQFPLFVEVFSSTYGCGVLHGLS